MKKIFFFFSILILCCTTVFAQGFTDVTPDHWAYEQVQFFSENGIVNGIGNGYFAPNDLVTREQLAKMISILYDRDKYVPSKQAFTDVTPDMWSYTYIDSVKDYLSGYRRADGTYFYNPTEFATREDVAYALVKICGIYNEYSPDYTVFDNFKDADEVSFNRYDYMSIAVKSGLMQGYDGELRPRDGITRAEAVTLLYRTIQRPVTDVVTKDEETVPEVEEDEVVPVVSQEITYSVTELNGLDAWGFVRLSYGNEVVIKNSDFTEGEGNYTIEIIKADAITDHEIICTFIISMDGEMLAYDVSGKFINYNSEGTRIISDDGEWNIGLKMEF